MCDVGDIFSFSEQSVIDVAPYIIKNNDFKIKVINAHTYEKCFTYVMLFTSVLLQWTIFNGLNMGTIFFFL